MDVHDAPRPLRGRAGVTTAIERLLGAVAEQAGGCLLLEGAAGSGKSRLLEHGVAAGAAMGIQTIVGRSTEVDQGRAFAPFIAQWPDLGDEAWKPPTELGPAPAGLSSHVDRFLARVEELGPCVLAIDDLQWADATTMFGLAALVRRLDEFPVRLILARRPKPEPAGLGTLLDAVDSGGQRIELLPLDADAVKEIVRDVLGTDADEDLLAVVGRAGGSPFYVEELIASLQADGVLVQQPDDRWSVLDAATPRAVLELVGRRLDRLDAEVRNLLQVASAFGGPFAGEQLAAVIDLSPLKVLTLLESAFATGLVVEEGDRLAFGHDIVREAAYRSMPVSVADMMHRFIGDHLLEIGSSAGEVALQYARCRSPAPGDMAILRSGAQSLVTNAPRLARECLERARSIVDGSASETLAVTAELARAMFWEGHTDDALAMVDDALESSGGDEAIQLRFLTLRAEILFVVGKLVPAADAFEQVAAHPLVDRRGLRLAEAGVCLLLAGHMERAGGLLRDGIAAGTDEQDPRATAEGLGGLAWHEALGGDPAAAVELGLEAVAVADGDPSGQAHRAIPWLFLAQARNWADDSTGAMDAFATGEARARAIGVGWHEPMYGAAASGELLRSGRWDDALGRAESVLTYSSDTGSMMTDTWAYATLIEIHRRRGDLVEARRRLAEAEEAIANGAQQGVDLVLWQRALVDREGGETTAGYELLRVLWEHLYKHGVAARAREFAPDVVRLAMECGDIEGAREVAMAMAELAEGLEDQGYLATAQRCMGIAGHDAALLDLAVRHAASVPRPAERACCEEDAAVAHARGGRVRQARDLAKAALAGFGVLGASTDQERLVQRLADEGVTVRPPRAVRPATGWESLTPTERMVAGHVAEGMTNAAIADALGVSRRTVESHLYRIYPKLAVANRLELALFQQGHPSAQ